MYVPVIVSVGMPACQCLCMFLSALLSVSLLVCVSVPAKCRYIRPCMLLSVQSVCQSVCPCVFVYLQDWIDTTLYVDLSLCQPFYLSVCQSVCVYTCQINKTLYFYHCLSSDPYVSLYIMVCIPTRWIHVVCVPTRWIRHRESKHSVSCINCSGVVKFTDCLLVFRYKFPTNITSLELGLKLRKC